MNNFINNIAYLERIFETLDEPADIKDKPGAEALDIFADGEAVATIREGDEVVVEKAAVTVPLVELPGADPFEVLSRKLGWAGSSIR